ncbi:hypothetical protein [Rhodococcus sp. NPDC058521]|uniref:hypothetical protein n=1 Tax=Rhodococcus sp. NPDC058521 TaxID=3346536 RepID=UPI00365CBA0E
MRTLRFGFMVTALLLTTFVTGCAGRSEQTCGTTSQQVAQTLVETKSSIDPAQWSRAAEGVRSLSDEADDQAAREQIEEAARGLDNVADALSSTKDAGTVPDHAIDKDAFSAGEKEALWSAVELTATCGQ